ncbi:aminotransferase class V-fold PLP-dependent enzyme [Agromyces aurantiacus]|uniref:Cysteine desulfurase n=1 Tax=Agromyces aurantiacus TaxID=165814 RepID=A0ABV9R564_9MICO|nr:SufS family cysteine desulfurase [Agromyces aurantiacus]MBM7503090.1 cysteine desulfurase/selenocysteine lyase [Agromyces aurantiacus]
MNHTDADTVGGRPVRDIRLDFPAFASTDAARPTAYLDSAATSQRPAAVLDAERDYLVHHLAAVHRGASAATGESTSLFEEARADVARFVGAGEREVVWAQNATDALNMVALGIADASAGIGGADAARFALQPGDEIVLTEAEHHANLLPWQRVAQRTGARIVPVRVDEHGCWTIDDLAAVLSERTRVVTFAEASNVTGLIAPVAEITALVRERASSAIVVLDACQSVPHRPVDFGAYGVDFAAFSAHKMLGPNGIGVLYGRAELLDALPPARTGGSTITKVTLEDAHFLPAPHRFEAGTQAVSQAIGLGAAVRYLERLGMASVAAHEEAFAERVIDGVAAIPGVRIVGPQPGERRAGLVSVAVDGVHAHDVGQFLDEAGIVVRVGHHCAQPLHRALGITATTRASAHVYTTTDEADRFVAALGEVRGFFGLAREAS